MIARLTLLIIYVLLNLFFQPRAPQSFCRIFIEGSTKIEMISNEMGQSTHDLGFFKDKDFSNLVFHRNHSQMETETWDDYLDDLADERSMQCN